MLHSCLKIYNHESSEFNSHIWNHLKRKCPWMWWWFQTQVSNYLVFLVCENIAFLVKILSRPSYLQTNGLATALPHPRATPCVLHQNVSFIFHSLTARSTNKLLSSWREKASVYFFSFARAMPPNFLPELQPSPWRSDYTSTLFRKGRLPCRMAW